MSNATAASTRDDSNPDLVFRDGLGDRCVAGRSDSGEPVERFRVIPELASQERVLRERVDRLLNLRHVRFSRLLGVESETLAQHKAVWILSEHERGVRLSDLLAYVEPHPTLVIDVNAALQVAREVLPALAVLHNSRGITHGALALERLVLTPLARVTIVDHALGGALANLGFPRTRLWREFRIAMPPAAGVARFDARADVANVGLAVLALLGGRPLISNDFPNGVRALLDSAVERLPNGADRPLSSQLKAWFERALPIESRRAFTSASDAQMALEDAIKKGAYSPSQGTLKSLLQRYEASKAQPDRKGNETARADPSARPESSSTLRLATPSRPRVTRPAPVLTPEEEEAEEIRALEAELARLAKLEAEGAATADATAASVTAAGSAPVSEPPADAQAAQSGFPVASDLGTPLQPPLAEQTAASPTTSTRRRRSLVAKVPVSEEVEIALDADDPTAGQADALPAGFEEGSASGPPSPAIVATEGIRPAREDMLPAAASDPAAATGAIGSPEATAAPLAEAAGELTAVGRHSQPGAEAAPSVAAEEPVAAPAAPVEELVEAPAFAAEEPLATPSVSVEGPVAATAIAAGQPVAAPAGFDAGAVSASEPVTADAPQVDELAASVLEEPENVEVEVLVVGGELPPIDVAALSDDTVTAVVSPREPFLNEPGMAQAGADEEIRDLECLLATLQAAGLGPAAAAPTSPAADRSPEDEARVVLDQSPEAEAPAVLDHSAEDRAPVVLDRSTEDRAALVLDASTAAADVAATDASPAQDAWAAECAEPPAEAPQAADTLPALATAYLVEEEPTSPREPEWALTPPTVAECVAAADETVEHDTDARDNRTLDLDFNVDCVRRYVRRLIAYGVANDELYRVVAVFRHVPFADVVRVQLFAASAPALTSQATLPIRRAAMHRQKRPTPPASLPERTSDAPAAMCVQPERALGALVGRAPGAHDLFRLAETGEADTPRREVHQLPVEAMQVPSGLACRPAASSLEDLRAGHRRGSAAILRFVRPNDTVRPPSLEDRTVPLLDVPAIEAIEETQLATSDAVEQLAEDRQAAETRDAVVPMMADRSPLFVDQRDEHQDAESATTDRAAPDPVVPAIAAQDTEAIDQELQRLLELLDISPSEARPARSPVFAEIDVSLDEPARDQFGAPTDDVAAVAAVEVEVELESLLVTQDPAEARHHEVRQAPDDATAARDMSRDVSGARQPATTTPAFHGAEEPAQVIVRRRRSGKKKRSRSRTPDHLPSGTREDAAPLETAAPAEPSAAPAERPIPYEPWRIPKVAQAPAATPPIALAAPRPVSPPAPDPWSVETAAARGAQVVPFAPVAVPTVEPNVEAAVGADAVPAATPIAEPVNAPRVAKVEPPVRMFQFEAAAPAEPVPTAAETAPPRRRVNWRRTAAASLAVMLLEGVAFATVYWFVKPSELGTLLVQTSQNGVEVLVDGRRSGVTPLKVQVEPGRHTLELRGSGHTKVVPVEISPGVQTTQTIRWTSASQYGSLNIRTVPAGARITVDGVYRGAAPVVVPDLPVGTHTILAESPAGSVKSNASVAESIASDVEIGIFSGWLTVFAPVEVRVFEGGKLLGTSLDGKLLVPPGTHQIEIVNKRLGYRESRKVEIEPGKHTALSVQPPNGMLVIDAPDGTEVIVDGQAAGTMPVPTLSVPIGTREIVLKHASFGQRRVTVTVTADAPARISMLAPQ